MSLKAEIKDPIVVKTLETIKLLDDEPVINATREGIQVKGLNKSHTMFHNIKLGKELFRKYCVDEEFGIGVDAYKLSKIMGRCKGDVELEITEEKIIVKVDDERARTFTIGAISTEYKDSVRMPQLEIDNELVVGTDTFKQAVADSKVFDNKKSELEITYNHDEESLTITSESELDDGKIMVEDEDVEVLRTDESESQSKVILSTGYVEDIMKFKTANGEWNVEIADNQPIIFKNSADGLEMVFMIAPILKEDF